MPTVSAGFGERFRQPCGDAGGENEGEGRGECGLYIGTGWGRNGRALTRIEGEELRGGNGLWRRFRSREEDDDLALRCGARCQ
jgi:hypothetical protein